MGTSSDFVKSLYDAFAKGDVATVIGALDGAIQWREAENYPYSAGNPYVGPEAVVEGVIKPLVADCRRLHHPPPPTSSTAATPWWSRAAIAAG